MEKIDGIESECIVALQGRLDRNKGVNNFNVTREDLEYLLKRCQPMQVLEHDDVREFVVKEVEKALDSIECECEEPQSEGVVFVLDGLIASAAAYSGHQLSSGHYELVRMNTVDFSTFVKHDERPNGDG